MDNRKVAREVVQYMGGRENITNALHCVTRLRFNLKDEAKADMEAIKKIQGVLGTAVQNGQYQVIIGATVGDVFIEVEQILGETAVNGALEEKRGRITPTAVLDVITGVFSPILPALVAGGMIKGIIAMFEAFGWISGGQGTWQVLSFISDVPFYFLPVLLGMSSAKKFKVNQYLGVCVAGALLYPSFMAGIDGSAAFTVLGMNVPVFNYSDSVFPVILGVGVLALVYHFIDKFVPDVLKMVVVPAVSLTVSIPLTYLFLAPIGAWGGLALADGIVWLFSTVGPLAGFLLGFFMPLIVLVGMHQSTSPIQISNIATLGYDYLLPVSFCHNMAESGASFGAALRMKNKELKSAAFTTSFSAFLGISEPALFTVNVANKTPLIAAMVANGIGGALTVILGAKCYAFVMPGITSLPVYANGGLTNFILMIVCIASTWLIAAVLSFILGGGISKKEI